MRAYSKGQAKQLQTVPTYWGCAQRRRWHSCMWLAHSCHRRRCQHLCMLPSWDSPDPVSNQQTHADVSSRTSISQSWECCVALHQPSVCHTLPLNMPFVYIIRINVLLTRCGIVQVNLQHYRPGCCAAFQDCCQFRHGAKSMCTLTCCQCIAWCSTQWD